MKLVIFFVVASVGVLYNSGVEAGVAGIVTTETMIKWKKTDAYCYMTEKQKLFGDKAERRKRRKNGQARLDLGLGLFDKKTKECDSERHKRAIVDGVVFDEDELIRKMIAPSRPAVVEEELVRGPALEPTSNNPSRAARFLGIGYIVTKTDTIWYTKYTGTTSITFKCTPRYSFIPRCEGGGKFDKKGDDDDDRYDDGHHGGSYGGYGDDHRGGMYGHDDDHYMNNYNNNNNNKNNGPFGFLFGG